MDFLDKTGLAYFYSKITSRFYNKNEIDSKIVQTNGLPTNTVMGFTGDTVPEGFDEVDSPVKHLANLFFPIGYTFIDTTGTTDYSNHLGFTWQKTLQGVTPIGQKTSDTDFATIGNTGGAKTITLSKANLPSYTLYSASHTHTFTGTAESHNHSVTDNGHVHYYPIVPSGSGSYVGIANSQPMGANNMNTLTSKEKTGISIQNKSLTPKGTNTGTTITVNSGGSGTAVNKLPPYQVVVFWTRIA